MGTVFREAFRRPAVHAGLVLVLLLLQFAPARAGLIQNLTFSGPSGFSGSGVLEFDAQSGDQTNLVAATVSATFNGNSFAWGLAQLGNSTFTYQIDGNWMFQFAGGIGANFAPATNDPNFMAGMALDSAGTMNFVCTGPGGCDGDPDVVNFAGTFSFAPQHAIAEPAAPALLGLGCAVFAALRRRRRR